MCVEFDSTVLVARVNYLISHLLTCSLIYIVRFSNKIWILQPLNNKVETLRESMVPSVEFAPCVDGATALRLVGQPTLW